MSGVTLTERQAVALRALIFYREEWIDADDVARFAADNGYGGQGPTNGWQNTLASLAHRGLADADPVPRSFIRYRLKDPVREMAALLNDAPVRSAS